MKNYLRFKRLFGKNRSTNEDLDRFFIKIAAYGSHNAAIDDKGCLYTWGERYFFKQNVFFKKYKIKSIENCLGFDDCVNLHQPTLLDCLQGENIIDVACGDNFTVAITNSDKLIQNKSIQNFKKTHFQNIKEKIKNYRSYSQSLKDIKDQTSSKKISAPLARSNRCMTKVIKNQNFHTERPKINSFGGEHTLKKERNNTINENIILKEEAKKYSLNLDKSFKISEKPKPLTRVSRTKSAHQTVQPLIPIVIYDRVAHLANKKEIDDKYITRIPLTYNPEIGMYKSEEDKIMEKCLIDNNINNYADVKKSNMVINSHF